MTAVAGKTPVQIDGRSLTLSNLGKVLYPSTATTKAEVIDYYARIAPIMLPHLRDRPVTLKRYPDGVESKFFYEKNCPSHRPRWIQTARVKRESADDWIRFCILNDLPSLVWAANLAAIELHCALHRADDQERPTMLAFDLDPGPPATIVHCAKIALRIRDALADLKLQGFIKASGGKGLHLYVPWNTPVTYEQSKLFAHSLAVSIERQDSSLVTTNMRKTLRGGKVFIDWSQNSRHKTTVCAYSLRAQPEPSVSMPLSWDEVEALARKRQPPKLDLAPSDVLKRVERSGDLFEAVLSLKQRVPRMTANLSIA